MTTITDQLLVKAMVLTCYDGAIVKRLVLASSSSNPNKSSQWHLEKTIWNLEDVRKVEIFIALATKVAATRTKPAWLENTGFSIVRVGGLCVCGSSGFAVKAVQLNTL